MTPGTGEVIKKAKSVLSLVFIIFAAIAFSSCDLILQAANRAAGAANKEITEFIFAAALNGSVGVTSDCSGDINGNEITVMVPFGTNLAALVANYSTTGASVLVGSVVQESGGTVNDFSNPVIYTVVAADKSTSDYTVRALPHPAIASFSFVNPAVTGTINHEAKTIAVVVPYGTNLTSLAANFATTGVSVKVGSTIQISGTTANDFTNPVTYTVYAADGSTMNYIVTVTVDLTAKDIASFAFLSPAVTGTINEAAKTISVITPYGTNVTSLVAIFTTTGVGVRVGSIEQVSGTTANDFTNPVIYVVSAADSTAKSYQVTVTVALNPAKDITSFSFTAALNSSAGLASDCVGNIAGNNISVEIPCGVDMTSLIATFTTTGAEVKVGTTVQISGVTHNDFTNPVTYVVRAEDLTTKSYTIIVSDWHTVGSAGFSEWQAEYTSLALDSSGNPYIAFRGNYGKATVMKYDNGSWQTVGADGFSSGSVYNTTIALDQSDTPYVAYKDVSSEKATVMKYASGVWGVVGTEGFSAGRADSISLAIDSSSKPMIAFSDWVNNSKATVMKYVGGVWQAVGTAGFSASGAGYTSLSIDSSDVPYVAFTDGANSSKVTVMKYYSGSWQIVGDPGFGESELWKISLALDSSGNPYVAYQGGSNNGKATVMKYDNGSWQTVGSAGFTAGQAVSVCLKLDTSDMPYVAYRDNANNSRATVMKYNGISWQTLGKAGFSPGEVSDVSLAFDSMDTLYVAFRDIANGGRATVMTPNK